MSTTRRSTVRNRRTTQIVIEDEINNSPTRTPSRRRTRASVIKASSSPSSSSIGTSSVSEESEEQCVTPPKQRKATRTKISADTPSRLLDKLNLHEEVDADDEPQIVMSKYRSARKTLNGGIAKCLPGREKENMILTEFFNTNLENKTSASIYISGTPGTGKTALVMKLLESGTLNGKFKFVYLNCSSVSTNSEIFKKLIAEFGIKSSKRMAVKDYPTAIENYLEGKHSPIILVLDEIDQLAEKNQNLLYTLFGWPSLDGSRFILVGIANSLDLTDRLTPRLNMHCKLKPNRLHFVPYTKDQIIEIFRSRFEEADVTDVFPPATIQLLAAKVAAASGDVRKALDIGRRIIDLAQKQGCENLNIAHLLENVNEKPKYEEAPVQMRQVVSVINDTFAGSQSVMDYTEESMPIMQKVILCTLLLILRHQKNKDVTLGRLTDVLKRVCEKRNMMAIDFASCLNLIKLIESLGTIRLVKNKVERMTKVILVWDEDEVIKVLQDKQLLASIVSDISSLAK